MPLEDNDQNNGQTNDDTGSKTTPQTNGGTDSVEKLVAAQVAEALKDIKGKLDKAYEQRDQALKKVEVVDRERKERELKQMEEEGKKVEALEIRLAEVNAKLAAAESRITELTRDVSVREALTGAPFRNDKAAKIAYKEIVGELVVNDKGEWMHKSGVSIKDCVEAFIQDEEQQFLFKPKASSGGGTSTTTTTGTTTTKKPLTSYSQDEVIKMAAEGRLPKRK